MKHILYWVIVIKEQRMIVMDLRVHNRNSMDRDFILKILIRTSILSKYSIIFLSRLVLMMNFSDFQKVKNLEIKVIKIILSADLDLVQILMDFSIMISDWVILILSIIVVIIIRWYIKECQYLNNNYVLKFKLFFFNLFLFNKN